MRNKVTLVLGWLAATTLSIVIAAAAVGSVRDNVTDRPSRLAQPETVAAVATTAPEQPPATTTATDPASVTSAAPSTTTTTSTQPSTTTTTTPAPPATTSAPAPPTTTSTWQLATYATDGGWVRVRYTDSVIELDASGPAPGYSAKVEHAGPDEVKVEFEGGDDEEYSISVKLEDGRPRVELED